MTVRKIGFISLWVMMGNKLNVFTVLYVQKICLILLSVLCGRNVLLAVIQEKCYCMEVLRTYSHGLALYVYIFKKLDLFEHVLSKPGSTSVC